MESAIMRLTFQDSKIKYMWHNAHEIWIKFLIGHTDGDRVNKRLILAWDIFFLLKDEFPDVHAQHTD